VRTDNGRVSNTRIDVAEGSEKGRVSEFCKLFLVDGDPHTLQTKQVGSVLWQRLLSFPHFSNEDIRTAESLKTKLVDA
jgi:hypothetical protein